MIDLVLTPPMVMFVEAEALLFPTASVKAPVATVTVPVPPSTPRALNVTVLVNPEPANPESDPRVTVGSDESNPIAASLKVRVKVHVSPRATVPEQPE